MKRLSFFVAQLLLGSIAMWAQTPEDGIYTILCPNAENGYTQRGAIAYKSGNDERVYLAAVGKDGVNATNATSGPITTDGVCGYWGIKTYEGKTWFYNLANGKTVNKPANADGPTTWADIASDNNVTFEYSSDAFSGQFRIKGNYSNNAYLSVSAWWGTQSTGGVRWYNITGDNGCNVKIEAVEESLAAELAEQYASNILAAEEKMGITHDHEVTLDVPVKAIGELSNNYAYTITSYARGQWTAVAGKDEIYQTAGTEGSDWTKASGDYTPIATNNEDLNQQWAILRSKKNNLYLYNVGQKKFFISNANYSSRDAKAALGEEPNSSGFVLTDRGSAVSSQAFYTGSDEAVRWSVGMNVSDTDYFFGVTNWTGQQWKVFQDNTDYAKNNDGGMYFKVVPVASFDPAEAMAKIDAFETEPVEPEIFTYTLASAGSPLGAVVTINGQEYTNINDQGIDVEVPSQLSLSDIHVSCTDGYVHYVLLDSDNKQINVAFKQLFLPAEDENDVETTYYINDTANRFVKIDGANISYVKGRSGADKFIFIEDSEQAGRYYIYDVTASKYLYYTAPSSTANASTTATSKIQMTSNMADANSWGMLGEDFDISGIDIFAGSVDLETVTNSTHAWNYRGGDGTVLNFYNRDDSKSSWKITESNVGSLACSTLVFSKPGEEFMHKLMPESGVSVTGVDFGTISGLELKSDRASYKYVSGTAPAEEGTYEYKVSLSDGTVAKVTLKVDSFLQSATPFMGWLSWNWFQRGINADNMTAIGQGLKDKGLVAAGFKTLLLDDTWANQTNDKAALDWNSQKFPNPTQFVQNVKDLGLKVGLYSDAGTMTCENFQPGSFGYEAQHLAKFDQWGIDFLKYDRCNPQGGVVEAYTAMGREIAKLNEKRKAENGTPFVYNACEWGDNQPWTWGAEAGASSWRSSHDVREEWCGNNSRPGVLYASDVTRDYWMYAGVNRFNDLDMMCIGLHGLGGPSNNTSYHTTNGGRITELTEEQARSQMSIWCMFASPLSLTCDVRQNPSADGNASAGTLPNPLITDADLSILTNADIIAINQDALGQQCEYMSGLSLNDAKGTTNPGSYSVYLKDLTGGRKALAIVNRGNTDISNVNIALDQIYLSSSDSYYVKNVWTGDVDMASGTLSTSTIAPYETKVYIFSSTEFPGTEAPSLDEAKAAYEEADANAWGLIEEYRENDKVQTLLSEYSEKILDIEDNLSAKESENGELTVSDYTTAKNALINAMNTAREAIETLLAPVDPESLIPSVTGYKVLAPISEASELKSGKYFVSVYCKNKEGLLYGNEYKNVSTETAVLDKTLDEAYVWTIDVNEEDGTFTLTNSQGKTLSVQGARGLGKHNVLYTDEGGIYDAANFTLNPETVSISEVTHWMVHQQSQMADATNATDDQKLAYLHCNCDNPGLTGGNLRLSYWEGSNTALDATCDKIAFYPAKAVYDREAYIGTIVVLVDMAQDGEADVEQIERVVDIILEK